MKLPIYKILCFSLLSLALAFTQAQPSVDVCLRKTATNLEVVLTSNGSFTGLVSNIQLTLKCSDPTVTYATPGGLQLFCTMARGGDVALSGGAVYQKFGGIGFLTLSTLGLSWSTGTETVLFTVVPSSLTPTFEIVDDSWTAANNGTYYVELNALDKTGDINLCGMTLPINELRLSGKKTQAHEVSLHWVTDQEMEGSRFVVEKRGPNGAFIPLAEIPATGLDSYRFLDSSPLFSLNYYQIRQLNPDGQHMMSNIIEIHATPEAGIQLYPNPTNEISYLMLEGVEAEEKSIRILNSLGQVIQTFRSREKVVLLDVSRFAEGIYHVQVTAEGFSWERALAVR